MLQMRADARARPNMSASSELTALRSQTLPRRHYVPRDPRLGGFLLACCDLAVFALVIAGVAAFLDGTENLRFAVSWPHYSVISALTFIVLHTFAKSYDVGREGRGGHSSVLDFVAKPALVTCAATTFSYLVERIIGQGVIDPGV